MGAGPLAAGGRARGRVRSGGGGEGVRPGVTGAGRRGARSRRRGGAWGSPADARFLPVLGGGGTGPGGSNGLPKYAVPGRSGLGRCQGHHSEGAGGGEAVPQGVPGGLHVRPHGGQGSAGRSGRCCRPEARRLSYRGVRGVPGLVGQ